MWQDYRAGGGRRGQRKPREVDDLLDKHLEIVAGTSYVNGLRRLQDREPALAFRENPNGSS